VIVVGVDFSEGAADAVAFARDLAEARQEELHLLHVDEGAALDEASRRKRDTWFRSLSIHPSEVERRTGVPWVEVVRAAVQGRAAVVVAGTHGESGYQPLRLGTTATNLALRAGRPVVLIPPRRDGMNVDSLNRGRKMSRTMRFLTPGLVLALALTVTGCGKKPAPVTPPPMNETATRDDAAERARREAEERARHEAEARAAEDAARRELARKRTVLEEIVFFDYDDASIRADSRATLDAKVAVLRGDGAIRLRVMGHADERGSTEYNLALGMRRAQSIKDYLAGYGITADRLEVQSFGEERPLATGHDEGSWSRNRRGEFSILAGLRAGG